MIAKFFFTSFLFLYVLQVQCQLPIFNKNWVSLGPNDMPNNPKYRGDQGIGPIEFIRAFEKKEGYLLAGSLSGGLFYSENGGDSWNTTGSDNWNYTGCAWADYHPSDENIWFACSNISGRNGNPGRMGEKGGLFRTKNKGADWLRIAGPKHLGLSSNYVIYGTRFDPNNSNRIFILTSEGIYYSDNCLGGILNWQRINNVKGWVYDMAFVNEKFYLTNFYHRKWSVLKFDLNDLSSFEVVSDVKTEQRKLNNLTIETKGSELLIAKDFAEESDEVCVFYPELDSTAVLLKNQRIVFGKGNTFTVSPHNSDLFFIGYGTRVRKWESPYKGKERMGSDYHVDVEYITVDPFDSSKVYFATHGGVFMSPDLGMTWESKNKNLGVSEVLGMAVSKSDANRISIGCFHDGTMLLWDENKDNDYEWRTINNGDGLLSIIHPTVESIIYTSNQYGGGGLYITSDTAIGKPRNIHRVSRIKSSGWEMATVLDHNQPNRLYFNFVEKNGVNLGNINVCRIENPDTAKSVEVISDFLVSHKMRRYKVYGLFNSKHHPNSLIAYVLDYKKDENGKKITNHRVFKTDDLDKTAEEIKKSWYELAHPNNDWIADIELDGYNKNKIYLSYTIGKSSPSSIFGDKGIAYSLSYRNNHTHKLKREIDITKNIPNSVVGRYNMVYVKKMGPILGSALIVSTRTGVYLGYERTLKAKRRWLKIGRGLPHCRISGIDYNEKEKIITVGTYGRGVWQYQM